MSEILYQCNMCESKPAGTHLPTCVGDDLQTILDCMSGADGGIAYYDLRVFLGKCAKEGTDAIFVRQLARLIRKLSPHIDKEI